MGTSSGRFFLSVWTLTYIAIKLQLFIIIFFSLSSSNASSYNYKIRMFSNLPPVFFRERDQFSLRNASLYIDDPNSLQNLIFFVNQVKLKDSYRDYDLADWNKVIAAFRKGALLYGIKILRPLKVLCLRILNQNMGFVELHGFFLALCLHFSVPKEALPIIEYPGLFKTMQKNGIAQFLIAGCDILIRLKRYPEAYQLVKRGDGIEMIEPQLGLRLLARSLVLLIKLGERIPEELRFKLKEFNVRDQMGISGFLSYQADENKLAYLQKMIDFYSKLTSYRPLRPEEMMVLKVQDLLEVFEESRWAQISRYIRDDIRKNNWRIKASDIKSIPLDNLQSIKGINSNEEIYRYDSKDKIMYFNHKESNQEQLNALITKALNMSQEVANAKVERKETGMGGPGGMMGMMGMMGRR